MAKILGSASGVFEVHHFFLDHLYLTSEARKHRVDIVGQGGLGPAPILLRVFREPGGDGHGDDNADGDGDVGYRIFCLGY